MKNTIVYTKMEISYRPSYLAEDVSTPACLLPKIHFTALSQLCRRGQHTLGREANFVSLLQYK